MRILPIVVLALVVAPACDRRDSSTSAQAAAASTDAASSRANAVREVTIPAGTVLPVVLDTAIGSDISHDEEAVHGHLARAIELNGVTVVPDGSRVSGVVTDAKQSGKVKGLAHVAVRFDTLAPSGDEDRYTIHTAAVGRTAESTKKKDALEIGGAAGAGALVGALVGGGKGAAIGTAVGGGGGAAYVMSTRGKEVHMPKGSTLTLRLEEPVTVRVRG